MSALTDYVIEHVRAQIADGWLDDEILDQMDSAWNAYGRLVPFGPGPRHRLSNGTVPLRLRREVMALLSAERGPQGITAYAREKIAEIAKVYEQMRRSVKSGRVSKSMVARKVGVDRGTIPDWEARGWMTWPPGQIPQK